MTVAKGIELVRRDAVPTVKCPQEAVITALLEAMDPEAAVSQVPKLHASTVKQAIDNLLDIRFNFLLEVKRTITVSSHSHHVLIAFL